MRTLCDKGSPSQFKAEANASRAERRAETPCSQPGDAIFLQAAENKPKIKLDFVNLED